MSKALRSVPAVSEDWPPLCRYSAALGNAGGSYNGLRVRRGQQIPMCKPHALGVITTQGWVVVGTERTNSCMAIEALQFSAARMPLVAASA